MKKFKKLLKKGYDPKFLALLLWSSLGDIDQVTIMDKKPLFFILNNMPAVLEKDIRATIWEQVLNFSLTPEELISMLLIAKNIFSVMERNQKVEPVLELLSREIKKFSQAKQVFKILSKVENNFHQTKFQKIFWKLARKKANKLKHFEWLWKNMEDEKHLSDIMLSSQLVLANMSDQ